MAFSSENIDIETRGTFKVFRLHGRIGMKQTEELIEALETVVGDNSRGGIALDLANVDFLGSRALGVLATTHSEMKKRGGRFLLVNPSPLVRELFRFTRMDLVFEIVEDLDPIVRRSEDMVREFKKVVGSDQPFQSPPEAHEAKSWERELPEA